MQPGRYFFATYVDRPESGRPIPVFYNAFHFEIALFQSEAEAHAAAAAKALDKSTIRVFQYGVAQHG
jgi:hypothetical protein